MNTDPSKTQLGSVKSYFALNQSFSKIQMDPKKQVNVHTFITGEKVLVFLQKKHLSIGNYDDDYISSLLSSNCIFYK